MNSELLELLEMLLELYKLYKLYDARKKLLQKQNRRWWIRPLNLDRNNSGYFVSTYLRMKEIDAEEFFIETRMSRPIYELLLNLLKEDLSKHSIRRPIDFECRLAVTLSYLSQGVSNRFLANSYKMGKATVRKTVLDTCDILWRVLSPIYVARPTEANYANIATEFEEKWNLPHCCGSIDGKHILIKAPPCSGLDFFNYKKNFSVVLFAVCDADYIFTDICVGAEGSRSDGGILKDSTFGKELFASKLPLPRARFLPGSQEMFPYYFVGDAAFPLRSNLMRPYPGKALSADKEIFNYRLSRARRVIENSFGILVARWRVLTNCMQLSPTNAERIVLAVVALHNFIKLNDKSCKYVPSKYTDWEDENHNTHDGEWRNEVSSISSSRLGANNASREAFNLRDKLKNYLCNEGAVSFQYRRDL